MDVIWQAYWNFADKKLPKVAKVAIKLESFLSGPVIRIIKKFRYRPGAITIVQYIVCTFFSEIEMLSYTRPNVFAMWQLPYCKMIQQKPV